ncbi:MAG TPA: hypothetical protein VE439_01510 [Anaerolineae bacterium]|jgi:hypothetical protein|nr:hypothetical protein [Anaerolineae bacterium]
MKKALVLTMALAFVLAMGGIAFALPVADSVPQTYSDTTGASNWSYTDQWGTKTEGSYRPFDDQTDKLYNMVDDPNTPDVDESSRGPHGAYITTSNKCKTCHAVHRADGIYYLLRADNADSACDYCHIGDARHSEKGAYYGSVEGKYTSNGHTIGAGPEIPDSSRWQWAEDRTLSSNDGLITQTVKVRQYDVAKNEMYKVKARHGKEMFGPVLLQCMTCHQVHNASLLIWKPGADTAGYKLLRNAPSGSCDSSTLMRGDRNEQLLDPSGQILSHGTLLNVARPVEVPNTTITASNTGQVGGTPDDPDTVYTIWTAWEGVPTGVNDGSYLAVWCADCHNLNIGYRTVTGEEFGEHAHTSRTHPVPYMVTAQPNNAAQCYSCHVTDMHPSNTCGPTCHIFPSGYKKMAAKSDFPHAGDEGSTKFLGNTVGPYVAGDGSTTTQPWTYGTDNYGNPVTTAYDKTTEHIDQVCLRCHSDIGVSQ